MKYGSLEWANDLLEHAKSELDKIATADEKGKAAAEGLGLTQYYTNLVKSLEDEISKGNYKSEDSSDEGEESVTMTCADYAEGDTELREYLEKILGNGQHDYDDLVAVEKDFYENEEPEDTNISELAKSITQQDLGRTFDKEEK